MEQGELATYIDAFDPFIWKEYWILMSHIQRKPHYGIQVLWWSNSHMMAFVGLLRGPSNSRGNKGRHTPSCVINLRTKNERGVSHFHVKIPLGSRATMSSCLYFFVLLLWSVRWILFINTMMVMDVD